MAYGQIDPARLEGDALRRWYVRSPADVEEERRSAAAQRYDQFFSGGDAPAHEGQRERLVLEPSNGDFSGAGWPRGSEGHWRAPKDDAVARGRPGARHLAASSSASQASSHETPGSCVNCHGHIPLPPLPPPFGPFPWPIGPFPSFRNIPGARPERPDRDRKQCEIQAQNDDRICGSQPRPEDVAVCRASASERRARCQKSGEVGTPPLDTAKRIRGW